MFKTNEYFDGKVKSIAFQGKEKPATIGVMAAGDYVFNTAEKERMSVITGELIIKLKADGNSIVPLIEKPNTEWDKPVLSSWYYKNHSVRSNDWHYIKYRDGSEELYNHITDPGEHINLAGHSEYENIIAKLQKSLPKSDALPAGTTQGKGDNRDRRSEEWIANDSIPTWLR